MHTVLIPLDYSKTSKNAASYAISLLRNQPSRFVFINVLDIRTPTGGMGSLRDKIEEGAKADLDKAHEEIFKNHKFPGHTSEKHLVYDDAVTGITDYAARINADIIVMGTTGASGIKEKLIGSIAAGVIKKAHVPVMVIPQDSKHSSIRKIGLATDYKQIKEIESYDYLINLLKLTKSELTIVNVSKAEEAATIEKSMTGMLIDDYLGKVPHRYEFLYGDNPVFELVKFIAAENIDILAMIRHDYSIIEGLFKRSSVEKIAMQTDVPLLSIPESAQ